MAASRIKGITIEIGGDTTKLQSALKGVNAEITPFVGSRCKTPVEEIQAAIDGAISKEQAVKLRHCRMILTATWHILTDLKPYTPEGFLESRPVKEEKILTTSQALNLLKLRGYVIKDDPLPTS